ncbi:ERF family protein [Sphingomonas montanisoli]|nr:ERF family protein [Sphingomonas montanisoli]
MEALATAHAAIDNVGQDREVEVPIKDRNNPGQFKGKYKFRYATLAGILHHVRPELTKNGVWYTQFVRSGEMVTRLFHKSGEWMDSGQLPMPDIKGSPQDIGSIISYFKRYSLTAALGLAAEEDNDAETGEREVSFRAVRSNGREQATESAPQVEEPPMGWGDWARGLINAVADQGSNEELDALRDTNKRYINAVQRVDRAMHADIGAAFTGRRAALDKNAAF